MERLSYFQNLLDAFATDLKDVSNEISIIMEESRNKKFSCEYLLYYIENTNINICIPYFLLLLLTGIIIIGTGSFLQKKQRRQCGCERFGLFYPFDYLIGRRHQFALCTIYAIYANIVYQSFVLTPILWDQIYSTEPNAAPVLKSLIKIPIVVLLGVLVYPLLAALSHDFIIIHLLSTIHTWLLLGLSLAYVSTEYKCREDTNFSHIMMYLPAIIAKVILGLYYPYLIVMKCFKKKSDVVSDLNPDGYVSYLLQLHKNKGDQLDFKETAIAKMKHLTKLKIAPGLNYPPLFLATLTAMFFVIYELAILILERLIRILIKLQSRLPNGFNGGKNCVGIILETELFYELNYLINNIADWEQFEMKGTYKKLLTSFVVYGAIAFTYALLSAVIISSCYSFFTVVMIALNFRRKQIETMRDSRNRVNTIAKKSSSSSIMRGFMYYSGCQIAYIGAGFISIFALLSILFLLFTAAVHLPSYYGLIEYSSYIFLYLKDMIMSLLFVFLIATTHEIMAYFVFSSRGSSMFVNHTRIFSIYMHFTFFYNVMLGLFSLLFRVIKSFFAFFLLIGRMDYLLLPTFIKNFDSPYIYYLKFVYMSVIYSHPIVLSFVNNLVRSQPDNSQEALELNPIMCHTVISVSPKNKRAIARWHLAYSLIRNPTLRFQRKQYLNEMNGTNWERKLCEDDKGFVIKIFFYIKNRITSKTD